MALPVGTLGVLPTLTVAGKVFTNISTDASTGLIVLYGFSGGTSNTVGVFTLPNATANYQVPANKTLRILALEGYAANTAGTSAIDLMYGTSSVAVGTSDPAGAVRNGNAASGRGLALVMSAVVGAYFSKAQNFTIPQNDYVYFSVNATNSSPVLTAYGYLE